MGETREIPGGLVPLGEATITREGAIEWMREDLPELLEVARVAFEPLYDSNVLVRHAACSLLGDLRDVVQAAVKAIETGDPIDLVENEVVPAQLAALAGLLDVHAKEGNPHPRVYAKLSSSLVEMLAAA